MPRMPSSCSNHTDAAKKEMDDIDRRMFVCQICNKFGGNSFSSVLRHIGEIHRHDPNLSIRCGIHRCPQTYVNYESFRSHVYRKHRDVLHRASAAHTITDPNIGTPDYTPDYTPEEESMDLSYYDVPQYDRAHQGAKFLLKIREQYRMPQSTLDKVVADFKGMWTASQEFMKDQLKNKLENKLCESDVEEIITSFDCSFPLQGLETEYLQLQYYKRHFNYLEPVERVLAQKTLDVNGQEKQLSECCYDISLIDSLQQLLHMDVVREQIRNSHSLSNGLMGDYCDGLLFSDHELFNEDPAALQIQLYYDELEVCNPLGSKTKKHKIGVVYYTLGNIDPKLRSSLKCIQLLSIAKYEFIRTHGVEELLKPIINDVLKLEQEGGVDFEINGEIYKLRGTVTVFSADYLAAWAVGGFKALMSAFRKCQFCMVTDTEMQTQFNETKVMLRTKSIYEAHCRDLDGPLHQHISTTFGMVANSALNQLNYFHIVKGLVPDIMHNVLEGSLELCMRHLLIQLIYVDKRFPLSLLNSRISSFCYGPDIKNKPSPIYREHLSVSGHLRQSASQMWCLGRFLPILIGDKIPADCPYWDNYLSHLHIMDEIFAPITSEERADYLAMLIEDFLEEFKVLYPTRPLTPKMHYLIHIPTWMKLCGPLIRLWCMRYEAKHSFFKHLSNILRNFKNISLTLARRHQLYMCYQMLEPSSYLRHQNVFSTANSLRVEDTEYEDVILKSTPELSKESVLWRGRSTEINGTTYKKDHVIVCGVTDEEPQFCQITEIYQTHSEEIIFVMRELTTTCYNHHYHAYEVHSPSLFVVYKYHQFVDHHPLHICKGYASQSLFVVLKYFICCK